MENSKIGWTQDTVNFWIGCDKVSPGCKNCYAEADQAKRRGRVVWGKHGTRSVTSYAYWRKLLSWQRMAEAAGVKRLVFAQSLSDTFEDFDGPVVNAKGQRLYKPYGTDVDDMPVFDRHYNTEVTDEPLTLADLRLEAFKIMERCPNLIFLCLSKRPENMQSMVPEHWSGGWPANIAAGASTENQEELEKRLPALVNVPAKIHFLSCEPLLSHLDFMNIYSEEPEYCCSGRDCGCGGMPIEPPLLYGHIDWVIVGGESGHKARPMQKAWALDIQRQCKRAGVPFFFKQWGEHDENGNAVGKSKSGELLDGIDYKNFPQYFDIK